MSLSVLFPVPKEKIRYETLRIRVEISRLGAELVQARTLLDLVQIGCDHPGQVTGYNERDGSWANPCPVCGSSS